MMARCFFLQNFMKELSKLTGEKFIDLDFVSFLRDTLMIEVFY
jgi:hypothetical protein